MPSTLNEGIDKSMAMLKIFKKYYKLKAEMNEIENTVKEFGFKSIEECIVLVTLVENEMPLTRAQLHDKTCLANSTINTVTTYLDGRKLVKQSDDKTDTSKRVLHRQIYAPTQAGIDLIEKLKQQLQ